MIPTESARLGVLEHPDGHGAAESACGDRIELFLRVRDGIVADARCLVAGCQNTLALGVATAGRVVGLPLAEALGLDASALAAAAGGLPPELLHVAELAEKALRAAVADAISSAREPWRRLYR